MPIFISFFSCCLSFFFHSRSGFDFLNSFYTRGQLNKNSVILDRTQQAEQERSELQRSLVESSSQYEQLSSENRGLTIALDELRRE